MAQSTTSIHCESDDAGGPSLSMPNRVWLARFGSAQCDPATANWSESAEEHANGLPPLWQPTMLETSLRWPGSKWDGRRRSGPDFSGCPMVGDRVVIHRTGTHGDILGIWLITGMQFNRKGLLRLSHRPLVEFTEPISAKYLRSIDPDIRAGWKDTFGAGARGKFLVELTDQAFFGVARASGVDPDLLVGAVEELPEQPQLLRPPTPKGDVASKLRTQLDPAAEADAHAFFAAVDHMFTIGCAAPDQLESDLNPTRPEMGVGFTAREEHNVGRFVALAAPADEDELVILHPRFVAEAHRAIQQVEEWALIVNWNNQDLSQTVYYPPSEVVRCFCPKTGVLEETLEDVFADDL